MVRRQGNGFVWCIIKRCVQKRHYEWIRTFKSRRLLSIAFFSSNFQGFEGEVWHQRWNGPAIWAGECTQMCPSIAHRMLCSLMRNKTRSCAYLFRSFYLKSSSVERAEKLKVFMFFVVTTFGLLRVATKICYSMLYFREKGKYQFLWELLFWKMECIVILITCWLIKT